MKYQKPIVILGAGLAGLAAAYRLKRDYRLVEKRIVSGGLCDTVEEDGFRFDRTGHLLHLRHGKIRRLVLKLLDEEPLRLERKSRIFSSGVYTHYPFQANTYGLPEEVMKACLVGFINAVVKREKAGARRINTFEEYIYVQFGEGIAKHFMIPYNAKLWGVHPREITADWCQRFVPEPNVQDVVAGAIAPPQEEMGYNANFLYPSRGIEALPNAFARRISSIEYGVQPKAIDYKRRRILISNQWHSYRGLISTLPLKSLVKLLVSPPKKIIGAAGKLRCTSLRYLDVALSRPCGTSYHWTYVPERKYPFYRVGCYSNFSKNMAPHKKSNLYVELASRSAVKLDKLMPKVLKGLKEMGVIKSENDIAFVRPRRMAHAYVVYDAAYSKSAPMILSWLERQRIFCAGRYARWEYAAMEDAIEQGVLAADTVKDFF
ncbi:MAG: NAD(P)-binding protein [Proteobacteria bacterium]|nr:NAD(P)-binding protein [Pseudomonadota bacterium]